MYHLIYAFVYLLSLLPFWLLYALSDFTRVILFNIIGYRKQVIRTNVVASFPDCSPSQHQVIIKQFEKNFCDQWIELIKLMTISPEQLTKRVQCDWKLFHLYQEQGISCTALLGHQFNWEYANVACKLNIEQVFAGMYLPVKSKYVNRLILSIRGRMGSIMVDAFNLRKSLPALREQVYVLGLLADQAPANMNTARWYNFLHRPCPFMTGPEKQARLNNTAVVFCETRKLKRGYYEVKLTEICREAKLHAPYFILDRYVGMLQQSIEADPAGWLWSHKRWKKKKEVSDVVYDGKIAASKLL